MISSGIQQPFRVRYASVADIEFAVGNDNNAVHIDIRRGIGYLQCVFATAFTYLEPVALAFEHWKSRQESYIGFVVAYLVHPLYVPWFIVFPRTEGFGVPKKSLRENMVQIRFGVRTSFFAATSDVWSAQVTISLEEQTVQFSSLWSIHISTLPPDDDTHSRVLGKPFSVVGVLVASETAIHRLSEQGQQRVLHIAAGAVFMDIIVGCLCEPQSGIKLAACQEFGVRGDGASKGCRSFHPLGASSEIAVSRTRPASSASLAPTLPIMPRYAAQIGSTLTGLRRTHGADLGNVG